jgi:hypothetical protein
VGVVLRRDNGHETAVKGNDGGGWSSDGLVLWLGRRPNGDTVNGGESGHGLDCLFIAVEDESRTVRGGWPTTVVQIKCFGFSSRGKATG